MGQGTEHSRLRNRGKHPKTAPGTEWQTERLPGPDGWADRQAGVALSLRTLPTWVSQGLRCVHTCVWFWQHASAFCHGLPPRRLQRTGQRSAWSSPFAADARGRRRQSDWRTRHCTPRGAAPAPTPANGPRALLSHGTWLCCGTEHAGPGRSFTAGSVTAGGAAACQTLASQHTQSCAQLAMAAFLTKPWVAVSSGLTL